MAAAGGAPKRPTKGAKVEAEGPKAIDLKQPGALDERTAKSMGDQDDSSFTDSTLYSPPESTWRKNEKQKVINLDELMKEDVTPPLSPRLTTSPLKTALLKDNPRSRFNGMEKLTEDLNPQPTLKGARKRSTNQEQFDKKHGFRRINLSLMKKLAYQLNIVKTWKRVEWIHFIECRIPVLAWLPVYDWRENLLRDIISGFMISIIYIPQGLAYGLMVGLPPIFGIYTGIVGPIVYALLGTSHHASTGAFAIIALMVGSVIEQITTVDSNASQMEMDHEYLCCAEFTRKPNVDRAIQLASLIAFFVGLIQLVEGLTCGAAIHVLVSQMQTMTGVKNVPRTSDTFGIVKFFICFFNNIGTLHYQTAICTAICCLFLIYSKSVVDPVFKPWLKIKFPMELFVCLHFPFRIIEFKFSVIFSILLCTFSTGTHLDFRMNIVGDIESGMIPPFIPDFSETSKVIFSAFSIAIVSFVIHIALAKLIAKELKYQINVNQEWLALGLMHIIASFFGCFAGGSSLSRTVTSARLGTKSQLSTIVVAIILLIIAFGAAPLFKYLPKTVLACIVVVNMKELYMKICWSRVLFYESTVDFFIFAVTFTAVVLINVNIGLAIGIVFALLTVVLRSQWAESTCLGRIPGTSDFKGVGHYRTAIEIPGIKVFRFDAPLYFANAELFISSIHCATGLDPLLIITQLKETAERNKKLGFSDGKQYLSQEEEIQLTLRRRCVHPSKRDLNEKLESEDLIQLTHIVIDCSSFPYIDLMGVDALARTHIEYKAINITVFFACCKVAVRQMFENSKFYEQVPKSYMFVSLQDAVAEAQYEQEQELMLKMRTIRSEPMNKSQNFMPQKVLPSNEQNRPKVSASIGTNHI